ncbi:MAG TPA: TAXI family TRAP transporter solute-binding subunit [Alphaproteobacteria bacterium]|jgi:hypothetical protein
MPRARVLALAIVAALALVAPTHAQTTYGFGTSPPGAFYYSAGTVIAKAFIEKSGAQMRTQPYGSPSQFIPIINRGELDFGISNIFELVWAIRGDEFYNGNQNKNLRMIAVMVPLRSAIYVRKDSDIRSLKDLKGRALPTGYASQPIIPPIINAWLEMVGLTLKDVKQVPVPNVVRGADEFAAGRTDVLLFALGAAKVQEVATTVGGVRMLDVPNTPANNAIVAKHLPFSYIRTEHPSPNLIGVETPGGVVAYDTAVFANKDVDDNAAYQMAKALYESETELAQGFKGLEEFKRDGMVKKLDPAQYHPGAVKFYTEKGMWPPKS